MRVPDLAAAVAALPRGLCGVVFRPEGYPPGLAPRIARLCRDRRLWLTVASGPVPAGAGRHLRRGRGRAGAFATASAHDRAEVLRARRAGAALVFLSPLFPTASHPGGAWLGPLRWARAAHGVPAAALGGVDGRNLRRVPGAVAAGAIGALLPDGRKMGHAIAVSSPLPPRGRGGRSVPVAPAPQCGENAALAVSASLRVTGSKGKTPLGSGGNAHG